MSPEFPLRIITDDGQCEVIDSPEELITRVDSLDSIDPSGGVWVRDAFDRSVHIRLRAGMVEVFALA